MLNNTILNNFNILNNKYFFVLCFYLKKTNTKIYHTLFIGYKFNYLFLNINIFIKYLRQNLEILKTITRNNGNILFLYTNNKILNFLIKKNSKQMHCSYLSNFKAKQVNLINYLDNFPDLVISLDYKTNAIFLNKISNYNVPVICFTNLLNSNIINNMFYYLMFNNKSLYTNIILIYLIFNNIWSYKKILGTPILKN